MVRIHLSPAGESRANLNCASRRHSFSKKTFPKGTSELAAFDLLDDRVEERMAMAIDGEIYQDAHLAPLGPDSEIYLIPKIGGG